MARPTVADQLIEEVESLHVNKRGYPASSFQEALATVIEMAHPETLEEKRLSVSTAYPNDSGRNIARLHPETMKQLSLESGDIIQVQGEAATVATVREVDGPDASRGAIRIDGFTRGNAEVDPGEQVVVRRIEAEPASRIQLQPDEGVTPQSDDDAAEYKIHVAETLRDRVTTVGDSVPVPATETDPFPEPPGKAILFVVTDVQPAGAVRITEDTELTMRL